MRYLTPVRKSIDAHSGGFAQGLERNRTTAACRFHLSVVTGIATGSRHGRPGSPEILWQRSTRSCSPRSRSRPGMFWNWGAAPAHWEPLEAPQPAWALVGDRVVPDAAQSAQGVLDAVLCADIETLDDAALDAFLEGRPVPDVLVFGDVLEHLRDPLAVLRRLVDRLAPGGTVAACIPNIGHWSVIASLMAGEWTYTDSGLLDRTHLRFFTAAQRARDAGGGGSRRAQGDAAQGAPGPGAAGAVPGCDRRPRCSSLVSTPPKRTRACRLCNMCS